MRASQSQDIGCFNVLCADRGHRDWVLWNQNLCNCNIITEQRKIAQDENEMSQRKTSKLPAGGEGSGGDCAQSSCDWFIVSFKSDWL